jgi:hypothetical protein
MVRAQTSTRRRNSPWREGNPPSPWAGLASPWVRSRLSQNEDSASGEEDSTPAPAPETTPEPTSPDPFAPLAPITTTDTAPAPDQGTDKDPIEIARERAQQQAIDQLQRRVEALEAAAAAEPITAPSPLQ